MKTNIGHLEAAAGIAGLIKTVLALKHRAIPANLHFHEPNPQIPFTELPLEVPCALLPCAGAGPIFAGVSSFGFGGTNAHVVLEGVAKAEPVAESRPVAVTDSATAFLLLVSARRPEALKALAEAYRDALANGLRGADVRAIAWSAAGRRGHHDYRLALVGCCRADWIAQLDAFLHDEPHVGLFSGRALGGRNPELAAALEACTLRRDRDGAMVPITSSLENEEPGGVARDAGDAVHQGLPDRLGPSSTHRPASSGFHPIAGNASDSGGGRASVAWHHFRRRGPKPRSAAHARGATSMRAQRASRAEGLLDSCFTCKNDSGRGLAEGVPGAIDPERPLDACGIDSLMAMDLKLEIEKDLAIAIPLTSLLVGPTLTELAETATRKLRSAIALSRPMRTLSRLAVLAAVGTTAKEATQSVGLCGPFSLSRPAVALVVAPAWRLRAHRGLVITWRVPRRGAALEIDVDVLRRRLQASACDRHAALRTTFPARDGKPVQRVHDAETVAVDFRAENASHLDESEMSLRLVDEARRPFDLEEGPLFRARLFDRAERTRSRCCSWCSIILSAISGRSPCCFGTSWAGFIAALLSGARRGSRRCRSRLPTSLGGRPARLAGAEGERLWAYWEKQLAGPMPVLDLPTDRPRPVVQTDRGASRLLRDRPRLDRAARGALPGARASLYTTLPGGRSRCCCTALTGQHDVIVGSPVAGRNHPGCAGVVGYFVNTLPMRADLSGNPTFAAFLNRVRKTVHAGLEHQGFPFPLMVERLNHRRDPGRSPVFQVMFAFQKAQRGTARELTALTLPEPGPRIDLGGLALELLPLELGTAQFDLTLVGAEQDGRLALGLEYNADLFDAATIDRFLRTVPHAA